MPELLQNLKEMSRKVKVQKKESQVQHQLVKVNFVSLHLIITDKSNTEVIYFGQICFE